MTFLLLLHALAACVTTSLVFSAAARKVRLTMVESTLEGDLDVQGAMGTNTEDFRNGFTQIRMTIRIAGDAPAEKLRQVVQRGTDRSVVFDSRPAAFAAASKLLPFSCATTAAARCRAVSAALFLITSSRTRALTSSSPESRAASVPVIVMNTNPCGVRSASLTSPCFIPKARSATAGARPSPVIGS